MHRCAVLRVLLMSRETKAQKQERAEQIAALRDRIALGATIYTTLEHVSRSGMVRRVGVYIVEDGENRGITWSVATALGYRMKGDAIVLEGCGMDMGYHLAYQLGRVLFPDGGPLEKSQREAQERRHGQPIERDGGYLLRHRWL